MLLRSGVRVPTPKSQNGMSNRLGTITLYVSNPGGQSSRYWSQRGVTPEKRGWRNQSTFFFPLLFLSSAPLAHILVYDPTGVTYNRRGGLDPLLRYMP